jgi:hypothetical protein
MNKLLIAALVGIPFVACTVGQTGTTGQPGTTTPAEDAGTTEEPDAPMLDPNASLEPEDRCLDGQDLDAADVDVSSCPPIPSIPAKAMFQNNKKVMVDLGAWEIGTTSTKETYKYGTLSAPTTNPRVLTFDTGSAPVNEENVQCWAKGYYRLRAILQNPPAEYVALRKLKNPKDPSGFQYRFFQFQTDLRNGPTGYRAISSFQEHLVKWVTVVNKDGTCEQPTFTKFQKYAATELKTHPVPAPVADAGAAPDAN